MFTTFLYVTPPPYAKVCKLEVTYLGENFPCLEVLPETEAHVNDVHQVNLSIDLMKGLFSQRL